MTDTNTNVEAQPQAPKPDPDLKKLDRLVGAWNISGPEISGQVRFEWMDGSFFLMQHFDLNHSGHHIKGIEIMGYEHGWDALTQGPDAAPSQNCTSRLFDNAGNTFTYTWEIEDDTLTIWGGVKGSPAKYEGKFTDNGNVNSGRWTWPGGGYESTMTRVR